MNVITYDVYKNTVKKHDGFNPVTSEKNYTQLQFRFREDDDWKNCGMITASFWLSNDNIVKSDAELLSDYMTATFDIPPEFSGVKGTLKVGLQGSYLDENKTVTIATNIITLNRNTGAIITEGANAELYEKIITLKADKATTLAGYGITDAYTKTLSNMLFGCHTSVTYDENFIPLTFVNNSALHPDDDFATGNEKIKYVFISSIVSTVDSGTFAGCTNLEGVFYGGKFSENIESRIFAPIRADVPTVQNFVSLNKSEISDYLIRAIMAVNEVTKSINENKLPLCEKLENKVSDKSEIINSELNYPSIGYLHGYYYDYNEIDEALSGKLDNTAGAVTTDNIANKAVTTDKIATGAINAIKIAPDAVRSTNIAQNQISTNHLQNETVTEEKLNNDVKDMLYMTATQNWVNALVDTAKTGGFFFNSTGKKIISDKYSGALIPVTGGDKLKVSARTSSASPYLVTFYSDYAYVEGTAQGESYTFLDGYGAISTDYIDEEITVPVGAKYAGINSYITGSTAIPLSVYKLSAIVYDTPVKIALNNKLDNTAGAVGTDNIADKAVTFDKLADDVKTKLQETVNTLPQCMLLPDGDNTRALYVDGRYLYNCHATNRAVTKCDIGIESAPENIKTIGGHAKTYPRGMAVGNGYLYVPYRDTKGGTGTSFSDEDVGGYLDIINLSDFSLSNYSPIVYPREPYDPGDGRGTRYYGKSHNAATYNNKYLCVTQQLGGWLLYDISTTPENPTLLYKCDNRAQSATDNTEFQQPAFYTDGTTVYLAIAGYDRHLLKIYNLNDPTYPICVYSGDLRELWQHGDTAYLHAMGLVCKYPYIYCSVAPHPARMTDFNNTMQGVAVVDVSDINRVKVNFYKIPNESRTANVGGEPSPQSVAITKNHLVMDMFDKGISVWSLANPAEPKFLGNLDTGATKVCSVLSTEDGRTFIGTEYQGGNLTMYRGI